MAWTAPKTDWANGELVSADDMNAIGEHLARLIAPPATASYQITSDIDSYSYEWVDIDSNNLNLSLTTTGGDVLAGFQGAIHRLGNGTTVNVDIEVDGNRQGAWHTGIISAGIDSSRSPLGFSYLIRNLSSGRHTFKLQWRSNVRGQGMKLKTHSQFWVREI